MLAGPDRADNPRSTWVRNRFTIDTVIRRSALISDGGYKLWSELAFGWAWDEPVCFPTCHTLAVALNTTRRTIMRLLDELEGHGLLTRRRQRRGNRFTLASTLPPQFDTSRLSNKELAAIARAQGDPDAHQEDDPHEVIRAHLDPGVEGSDVTETSHLDRDPANHDVMNLSSSDVMKTSHQPLCDVMKTSHQAGCDVMNSSHKADVHPKQNIQEEEKQDHLKQGREPAAPDSKSTEVSEGDQENEGEQDDVAEAEDLLSEKEEVTPRRPRRQQRASSPDLITSRAKKPKVPYPEAQGSSTFVPKGRIESEVTPPPVETARGLLSLLRGEVESKWGQKATRLLPTDPLELPRDLQEKLKSAILNKYSSDVILDLVRLLVWDWEVARGVCFPFRPTTPYPDPLALVQYHKELATRVNTGFDHSANEHRGKRNTYKWLFIDKKPKADESDLIWW